MNSRLIKIFHIICTFLILLSLASCSQGNDVTPFVISTNTYVIEAGETVDVQTLIDMFVTDTEASPGITEPPVTTQPINEIKSPDTSAVTSDIVSAVSTDTEEVKTVTVYWVTGGEVWHTRSNCPSLSRSKNILSGTTEDAVLAGKVRVCKRCGG